MLSIDISQTAAAYPAAFQSLAATARSGRSRHVWNRSPIAALLTEVIADTSHDRVSKLRMLAAAEALFEQRIVLAGGSRTKLHPVVNLLEAYGLRQLSVGLGNATISGVKPSGRLFTVAVPRVRAGRHVVIRPCQLSVPAVDRE